jgi:glucosamine--fructose-6-phosphate aminotransferase (isomerizing)
VIENYDALKRHLIADGVVFHSDTDTEVIAHLLCRHFDGDLLEAVRRTLPLLKGTYGLAVVSPDDPDTVVGARLGSPLVLGVGAGEHLLASDPGALVGYTQDVVYLQDHQVCRITADDWDIFDRERRRTPARARSSTTCSRRSTSSPRRSRTPCAAGCPTPRRAPTSAG